ncbi:MAG: DUF3592 domain-containing protein [Spirosomataceae bacterium]
MKNGITSWVIFCSVFSLVGIVCLCFAYFFWNKTGKLKATGIKTTGLVIAHHKKRQITPSTASAVVVQYMYEKNQPRVYYSTTYTTPPLFAVGETITIWYQKDKPDEILMEGKDEWLLTAILGGFGLVFSLIGLPALLKELFS